MLLRDIIWATQPPTESFSWPLEWSPKIKLPDEITKDLEYDLSWRRCNRSPEEIVCLLKNQSVRDEWFTNQFESDQQRSDYDTLNTHPAIRWRKQIMITVNPEWIFLWHVTKFQSQTDWTTAQLLR